MKLSSSIKLLMRGTFVEYMFIQYKFKRTETGNNLPKSIIIKGKKLTCSYLNKYVLKTIAYAL